MIVINNLTGDTKSFQGVDGWIDKDKDKQITKLNQRIDGYRDYITKGQYKTARNLLKNLNKEIVEDNISSSIPFRITANIAVCDYNLGNIDQAAEGFIQSFEICPKAPNADAFKVMGLFLQRKMQEAVEFGMGCISLTQNKPELCKNILYAKAELPKEDKPFNFIPKEIEEDPNILIGKINYYIRKNEKSKWHQLASEAFSKHPEDKFFNRIDAEARLDRIFEKINDRSFDGFDSQLLTELNEIINRLRILWDEATNSESAWNTNHLALTANLASTYMVVRDFDGTREVLDRGLTNVPEDQNLLERRFTLAVKELDSDKFNALLPQIPLTRDTFVARLEWIYNSNNWQEIRSIPALEDVPYLDESDQAFYEAVSSLAFYNLGKINDLKNKFAELKCKYPDSKIIDICFYRIAELENDREWMDKIYNQIITDEEKISLIDSLALACMANLHGDYDRVIEMLKGKVDLSKDSPGLRELIFACANSKTRGAGIEVAKNLNEDLTNEPEYAKLMGTLYFNMGNLASANKFFNVSVEKEPNNTTGLLGLIRTLFRESKIAEASKHIKGLNTNLLDGPPIEKMCLAWLISQHGRTSEALEYSYRITKESINDVNIMRLYFDLVAKIGECPATPLDIREIQIDTSVEYESEDGNCNTFTIENKPDNRTGCSYARSDPFVEQFMGKKVGDKIIKRTKFGSETIYRITSVESKYMALFNKITNILTMTEDSGIYAVKTKSGDISPILKIVKERAEQNNTVLSNLQKFNLPLEFSAKFFGNNVSAYEYADILRHQKGSINTCIGLKFEREQAILIFKKALQNGVCLDSYTAMVAYDMEILPLLKGMFPKLRPLRY